MQLKTSGAIYRTIKEKKIESTDNILGTYKKDESNRASHLFSHQEGRG